MEINSNRFVDSLLIWEVGDEGANTSITRGSEYLYDDDWNIVLIFVHEEGHSLEAKHEKEGWRVPDSYEHFNINLKAIEDSRFEKMTNEGKKYLLSVARGYIDVSESAIKKYNEMVDIYNYLVPNIDICIQRM